MPTPTITIVVPTFQRARLLDQTLQSIASQKLKPYEVLILDNASTDDTDEVVAKYRKYGFRYIKNRHNIGMIENWNKGVRLAKGSHISLLHSDDLISPDWYRDWINVIRENKADYYLSPIIVINEKNEPRFEQRIFEGSRYIPPKKALSDFLSAYAPHIPPTAASVYDKRLFTKIGLFKTVYGPEADVPFWYKVMNRADIYYHDKILFANRTHPYQAFDRKVQKKTETHLVTLDNYFKILTQLNHERYFMQVHVLSALAGINLHLAKLRLGKVLAAHRIAFKYFPDLYRYPSDWMIFFDIQLKILRRAFFGRLLSTRTKKEIAWLRQIRSTSPQAHQ